LRRLACISWRGLAGLAGRLRLLRQLLRGILRAAYARNHPQPDRHQGQRRQRQHILPGRLLAPRDPPVQQLGGVRGFHHQPRGDAAGRRVGGRNLHRRGQLLIQVKAPVKPIGGRARRQPRPQQQHHRAADDRQRRRADHIYPQRPAPQHMPAQRNTPDTHAQPCRAQQHTHAPPRPAVGRKLIKFVE
jgi:hypothetical protein